MNISEIVEKIRNLCVIKAFYHYVNKMNNKNTIKNILRHLILLKNNIKFTVLSLLTTFPILSFGSGELLSSLGIIVDVIRKLLHFNHFLTNHWSI